MSRTLSRLISDYRQYRRPDDRAALEGRRKAVEGEARHFLERQGAHIPSQEFAEKQYRERFGRLYKIGVPESEPEPAYVWKLGGNGMSPLILPEWAHWWCNDLMDRLEEIRELLR